MLLRLIRFFRGYVSFQVIGRFPERFVNICVRRGYFVFDAISDSQGFFCCLLLCDYKQIRYIARQAGVRLRVRSRHGLPFLLHRYKHRLGLMAGTMAFLIITIFLQSFVWTVDIHGADTISQSRLRAELSERGVFEGAYKNHIDPQRVERTLMQEMDSIGWMSVNIIGTKAEIEIKEKEYKPLIEDQNVPANITASRDGIIQSVRCRRGMIKTMTGSAVKKGQLLVSGIVDNSLGEISFVDANAIVMAETHREESFYTELTGESLRAERFFERQNLKFLWFCLPIRYCSASETYTSRYVTEKVFINDTALELGTITEYGTQYVTKPYNLTPQQGRQRLLVDEALFRVFSLSHCEEICAQLEFSETEDDISLAVTYSCVEDIANKEKIIVN